MFDNFLFKIKNRKIQQQKSDLSSREECGNGRSRQALSNEYLIAAIGLDTEDNGPIKVWG